MIMTNVENNYGAINPLDCRIYTGKIFNASLTLS